MRMQMAVGVSVMCLVLGSAMHAKDSNVRGFVVDVSKDAVQIGVGKRPEGPPRASAQTTTSVRIDDHTTFVKWITHQPWGQSTDAKRTMLTVGQCVEATMRDGGDVANTIRISLEPPTSLFDPCK